MILFMRRTIATGVDVSASITVGFAVGRGVDRRTGVRHTTRFRAGIRRHGTSFRLECIYV